MLRPLNRPLSTYAESGQIDEICHASTWRNQEPAPTEGPLPLSKVCRIFVAKNADCADFAGLTV
jgi:hypothetical protein